MAHFEKSLKCPNRQTPKRCLRQNFNHFVLPKLLSKVCVLRSVTRKKIAKCLQKLPKYDFSRKMIDFDTFTKNAQECGRFGKINYCQML